MAVASSAGDLRAAIQQEPGQPPNRIMLSETEDVELGRAYLVGAFQNVKGELRIPLQHALEPPRRVPVRTHCREGLGGADAIAVLGEPESARSAHEGENFPPLCKAASAHANHPFSQKVEEAGRLAQPIDWSSDRIFRKNGHVVRLGASMISEQRRRFDLSCGRKRTARRLVRSPSF